MGGILGAIIAGGQSRRFGSDKALVQVDGKSMFEHVRASLSQQLDAVIVCGREWPGLESLRDRPLPNIGPLGGICAALHYGRRNGYAYVITAPVDVIPFPQDFIPQCADRSPRVVAEQFMIGGWPTSLAEQLDDHLKLGHRSVRSWILKAGAQYVDCGIALSNINHQSDLNNGSGRSD